MKKPAASGSMVLLAFLAFIVLMTCGKDSPNNSGTPNTDTTAVMDLSVVGDWEGVMFFPGIINEKVFIDIAKADSNFFLVTCDSTRDTTKNPAIKDTTLVLSGTWKLNTTNDSIVLLCDTSRIIDTTLNVLSPRNVRGQTIPIFVNISKNTNDIEWTITYADLVPLATLLNLNLTGYPIDVLKIFTVLLVKKKQ